MPIRSIAVLKDPALHLQTPEAAPFPPTSSAFVHDHNYDAQVGGRKARLQTYSLSVDFDVTQGSR